MENEEKISLLSLFVLVFSFGVFVAMGFAIYEFREFSAEFKKFNDYYGKITIVVKDSTANPYITVTRPVESSPKVEKIPEIKVETSPKPTGNMPNRCYAEKYIVVKGNDGKYYGKFPDSKFIFTSGGTYSETHERIVEMADFCREKWLALGE